VRERFAEWFGEGGEPELFFAPGRVNLIGEHTDYTGGLVFPSALSLGTWALARKREDGKIRLASLSFPDRWIESDVAELRYRKEDGWANYPKGVIREFQKRGALVTGMDILYDGNLPLGAGLSSSASIELVTAVAVNHLFGTRLSMKELVVLSQRAENQFVGVACGIMDQFAVGMGKAGHAVLLDCHTLSEELVPLELGEYRLVITHTGVPRGLAESRYNERRREAEAGFRILKPHLPGVDVLGQVTPLEWERLRHLVQDETIRRRLEHVVGENERVRRAAEALRRKDLSEFGLLMNESHRSLRDLYEVTGPQLDSLAARAQAMDGCLGSRMTGAGFGGCTVSLVRAEALDAFKREVEEGYRADTGLVPRFFVAQVGDGARKVEKGDPAWRSW
jgi:galactokinase